MKRECSRYGRVETGVLVEIELPKGRGLEDLKDKLRDAGVSGFFLDEDFRPVLMSPGSPEKPGTAILRGWIESEDVIEALRKRRGVINVWKDSVVAPMGSRDG